MTIMFSSSVTAAVLAGCLIFGSEACRTQEDSCRSWIPCCAGLECELVDGDAGFCKPAKGQPSESAHAESKPKPVMASTRPSTTKKPSRVQAGGSVSSGGSGSGSAASHSFASGSSGESPYESFHAAYSSANGPSSAHASSYASAGSSQSSPAAITKEQFRKAVTANGFPNPSDKHYDNIMKRTSKLPFIGNRELAMFLAHVLFESDGLRSTGEYKPIYAPDPEHPDNGKSYYGRGYLQLSWVGNYRMASRDLFGDDRLVKDPYQVATNEEIAWNTAFWYWVTVVRNTIGVTQGRFGASVMAVNGANECAGGMRVQAKRRFEYYKKILAVFVPGEKPIENGCYN